MNGQPRCLSFNLAKNFGNGEDADPLVESLDNGSWLIGVFDGLGGAGSRLYKAKDEERAERTGAYIASRCIRESVLQYFSYNKPKQVEVLAAELKKYLQRDIQGVAEKYKSHSRLQGSLVRQFPTTMAVIYCRPSPTGYLPDPTKPWRYFSIWAGDSRGYVLDKNGLRQLTEDDLRSGGDALENLSDDSPISNCVSADGDFTVNVAHGIIEKPSAFLVATDGCFGYLSTPMHFEWLLLESLQEAENAIGWQKQIEKSVKAITGDDASIGIVICEWPDFQQLRSTLRERTKYLEEEYIQPLRHGSDPHDLWEKYKGEYTPKSPKG